VTAPEKWLDAADIERKRDVLNDAGPDDPPQDSWHVVLDQAEAALTLRDELREFRAKLGASQARERELREDFGRLVVPCANNCDCCQDVAAIADKALARPADDSALREMLTDFGIDLLDDMPGDRAVVECAVSRLLGGGK